MTNSLFCFFLKALFVPTYLFIYLFICLFFYLFTYLFIYLFIHLFILAFHAYSKNGLIINIRLILKTMTSQSRILVVIFSHFLLIQLRSRLSQVKRYLISRITSSLKELPHELPNDLRLKT